MEKVISSERVPIKIWSNDIEDQAIEQAKNLANLPFAYKHIALMPDAHLGYGMPIGGVLATTDVIVPNAVGVDIGCGLMASKTNIKEIDIPTLKSIIKCIRNEIPIGKISHKEPQDENLMPADYDIDSLRIVSKEYNNALKQIGTLGGGNHFIEIQKDNNGYIWIMLHSGSRNLGYKVANHYNKIAIELNLKYCSSVPLKVDLAFLPLHSYEGNNYFNEMQYCVYYALCNREVMLNRVKQCMKSFIANILFDIPINIPHNYAAIEHHYNRNVIVHRKGATRAFRRKLGIIPGSQGTASYIVKGKGNPESFQSCSHGAGRKLSRKKARELLDMKEEKKKLDESNILHSIRGKKDMDEAPGAYKDIYSVMSYQSDLVDIVAELHPLAVIKG